MQYDQRYDDIRPFTDREAVGKFPFAAQTPYLQAVLRYACPQMSEARAVQEMVSCGTIREFLNRIICPAVERLLENTSCGVTFDGLEKLEREGTYVFLSNHRDIVMDSVLLNYGLLRREMNVAQSAIGNNLVPDEGILTVARINKNFVVRRDLSPRDTLAFSQRLSQYIGYVLSVIGDSVWIAHREGRAKDGDDRTNPGVIKMLAMAGGGDMVDYLKSLRIVPMAISYEWDATDALKLRELLAKARGEKYVKSPGEDFNSIVTGIVGRKGRVEVSVGQPLDGELDALRSLDNDMRRIRAVASITDAEIYRMYRLFPNNYAAADLLEGTSRYAGEYSPGEKEEFEKHVGEVLAAVGGGDQARRILLEMYANPVKNKYGKEK